MNIKEIYDNALLEKYKAESIASSIQIEIESIIRINVKNKYKDKILIRDNNQYKLYGVKTSLYPYSIYNQNSIDIYLYYICISKMTIKKEQALKIEIERFERHGYIRETNHKIPITHRLCYEVELESLLNNSFGLDIT